MLRPILILLAVVGAAGALAILAYFIDSEAHKRFRGRK